MLIIIFILFILFYFKKNPKLIEEEPTEVSKRDLIIIMGTCYTFFPLFFFFFGWYLNEGKRLKDLSHSILMEERMGNIPLAILVHSQSAVYVWAHFVCVGFFLYANI
jgi:hypothetical protein